MKTKAVKIGSGIFGGGGLLAFIFTVANAKEASLKEYVDLKDQTIQSEIRNLSKGQDKIMRVLEKIDKRIYKLNEGQTD